jgi:hypothetical protein
VTARLANWLAERQANLTDLVSGSTLEDVYFEAVGPAAVQPAAEPDTDTDTDTERAPGRRRRRSAR